MRCGDERRGEEGRERGLLVKGSGAALGRP